MSKPEPKKTKGMCIATRCTSVEQFIQMFHRFVDEDSFFVSTLNTRPPGLETSFSVQLVDGTPVLRGLCVVQQAWTDNNNPFKTPGVRLGIKRLTANSMVVFEQLLLTRSAAKPPVVVNAPVAPAPPAIPAPGQKPSGPAPQVVIPVVTRPLGAGVAPKLPAVPSSAAPKPLLKSPFTETAPTKSTNSRLEIKQPVRPSTAPTVKADDSKQGSAKDAASIPAARAASEPIPVAIPAEPTDVVEEKTDIREPRQPVVRLGLDSSKLDTKKLDDKKLDDKKLDDAKLDGRNSEPTLVNTKPDAPEETRTPGSELILPANPLQNLTDESLEGYVDCTLYEETGNFFPLDEDPSQFVDDVVPPPVLAPRAAVARTPTPPPMERVPTPPAFDRMAVPPLEARKRTITPLPAAPDYEAVQLSSPSSRDSSPTIDPTPLPPPARDSGAIDPSGVGAGSSPGHDADARADDARALPLPAPAASTPRLSPTPHKRPRWWLLGGAVGVLAAAAAVVVITTSSSDGGNPAPPPKPAPVAKHEVEQVARATDTDKPAVDTEPDERDEPDEPRSGNGPPVVGSGPCKVVVNTTPAGSIIALDDANVGPSPITVAASCDKHKLDISHARYAPVTKQVTLGAGKPEQVEVTLSRPTHVVTVTSTPPGATIFIDGRTAGTTPTKLSVLGFTTLKLEFKKTGFQPASTKLYSKVAQDNVTVKLTKW